MSYFTPSKTGQSKYTEKRSSFIGMVCPVESENDARGIITDVKSKYHDARHNCWCFLLPDGTCRYSDDGEPQGTAGLPMLELFRKNNVYGVLCVVTRYFGGVLLGTGGLLRAYTTAAKDALNDAGVSEVRPWRMLRVNCDYGKAERVKTELISMSGISESVEYGEDVELVYAFPFDELDAVISKVTDLTSGTAKTHDLGTVMMAVPVSKSF